MIYRKGYQMTNKEHVLKYLDEHEDELVDVISSLSCGFCGAIGLRDYCRNAPHDSCTNTIESWLKEERVNNLFPIGTVIEVTFADGSKTVGYYNGLYNGKHYVTYSSTNIGKVCASNKPFGSDFDANTLKKVGDSNA